MGSNHRSVAKLILGYRLMLRIARYYASCFVSILEVPCSMAKISEDDWRAGIDRVHWIDNKLKYLTKKNWGHPCFWGKLETHLAQVVFCLLQSDSMGSVPYCRYHLVYKHGSYSSVDDTLIPSIREYFYICTHFCIHLLHSFGRRFSFANFGITLYHNRTSAASCDNLANYARKHRHLLHEWYHCMDTKLFWNGTCRSLYL
jgi:hypothetical protein